MNGQLGSTSEFECQTVSWQDMDRFQNSSIGNHIVDAYIMEHEGGQKVLMLRKKNLHDNSHLVLSSKCNIYLSGETLTLCDFLNNFGEHVRTHFNSRSCQGVSLAKHQDFDMFPQELHATLGANERLCVLPFDQPFETILNHPALLVQYIDRIFSMRTQGVPSLQTAAFVASVKLIIPMIMDFTNPTHYDKNGNLAGDFYKRFVSERVLAGFPGLASYGEDQISQTIIDLMNTLSNAKELMRTMEYSLQLDPIAGTESPNPKKQKSEGEGPEGDILKIDNPRGSTQFKVGDREYLNHISGLAEEVTMRYMVAWLVLGDREEVQFTCALQTYSAPALALLQYTDQTGKHMTSMKYLPARRKTILTITEKVGDTFKERTIKATPNADLRHDGTARPDASDTVGAEDRSCVVVYQIPLEGPESSQFPGGIDEFDFGETGQPVYRSLSVPDDFAYAAKLDKGDATGSVIDYCDEAQLPPGIRRARNANVTVTKCYYSVVHDIPNESSIYDRIAFLRRKYSQQAELSIYKVQTMVGNLGLRLFGLK